MAAASLRIKALFTAVFFTFVAVHGTCQEMTKGELSEKFRAWATQFHQSGPSAKTNLSELDVMIFTNNIDKIARSIEVIPQETLSADLGTWILESLKVMVAHNLHVVCPRKGMSSGQEFNAVLKMIEKRFRSLSKERSSELLSRREEILKAQVAYANSLRDLVREGFKKVKRFEIFIDTTRDTNSFAAKVDQLYRKEHGIKGPHEASKNITISEENTKELLMLLVRDYGNAYDDLSQFFHTGRKNLFTSHYDDTTAAPKPFTAIETDLKIMLLHFFQNYEGATNLSFHDFQWLIHLMLAQQVNHMPSPPDPRFVPKKITVQMTNIPSIWENF